MLHLLAQAQSMNERHESHHIRKFNAHFGVLDCLLAHKHCCVLSKSPTRSSRIPESSTDSAQAMRIS